MQEVELAGHNLQHDLVWEQTTRSYDLFCHLANFGSAAEMLDKMKEPHMTYPELTLQQYAVSAGLQ